MIFVLKVKKTVSAGKTHITSLTTKTNESVRGRIRCKDLTRDGYLNRLFIIKSSKGYIIIVAIQYIIDSSDLSLFSFISFPR